MICVGGLWRDFGAWVLHILGICGVIQCHGTKKLSELFHGLISAMHNQVVGIIEWKSKAVRSLTCLGLSAIRFRMILGVKFDHLGSIVNFERAPLFGRLFVIQKKYFARSRPSPLTHFGMKEFSFDAIRRSGVYQRVYRLFAAWTARVRLKKSRHRCLFYTLQAECGANPGHTFPSRSATQ